MYFWSILVFFMKVLREVMSRKSAFFFFQYLDILQHKCFLFLFSVFDESFQICHVQKICVVLRYLEICNITFSSSFKFDNDKCFWNILVVLMKMLREVKCKKSAFFFNILISCNINVSSFFLVFLMKVSRYVISIKSALFFDILRFAT